jgi:radical SAM superfamily enzyme YgiQ (UPF0313 family)
MRKIVIIIPHYSMERIRYGYSELTWISKYNQQVYPQLGMGYIISALKNNGYDAIGIDCTARNLEILDVVKYVANADPLFVGIYVNSFSLRTTKLLIKGIKQRSKSIVVLGGPHITSEPESVGYLGADLGIAGEGEDAIVELANRMANKEELSGIEGLIISNGGECTENGIAVARDIDTIFPYRDEKEKHLYRTPFHNGPMTTMITSRGCPYNCTFCASHRLYKYRRRSIDSCLEEMEYIAKRGYKYIQFQDDAMNIDRGWFYEFIEGILKRGINNRVEWDCNLRADLFDEELATLLYRSGCRIVKFGIETMDRDTREGAAKRLSDEDVLSAIEAAKRHHLKTLGYFMFGLEGENREKMTKSLSEIMKLGLNYADFTLTKILPATQICEDAIDKGLMQRDRWRKVADGESTIPVYVPEGMNISDMRVFLRRAFLRFYLRPSYITSEFFLSIKERRLLSTLRSFYLLLMSIIFGNSSSVER